MKKCIKDFYTGIVKNKKLKTWIKHWILSIPAKIKGIWSEIITGTTFTLENSLERVFNKFDLKGNTSQNTTTQSANLFDANYYNNDTLYSTGVYKYTKLKIKGDRILVFKAKLKEGKTTISGLYLCISTVGPNPNQGTSAFSIRGGLISETDYYANFTGSDDIYLSFYPNTISVADIFATYDLMISTSDINYVPFVPDSPSPDYPQSVQTVSGNNTITISNSDGTTEQNLTINLGDIELCKIGTTQDYFYKDEDKWYLHKATGKIILDGTENWNEYPSQTSDGYRVYETVKPAGPSGSFWLNNGRIL